MWYNGAKKGGQIMVELLEWMECIEDKRQAKKVRHKLKDILQHCQM